MVISERNALRLAIAAVAASMTLAGCAGRVDTRGNLADPEVVGQITPGQSTRGTVQDLLGSPTTVATFDDRTWYYIGRKTEKLAFFEPKTLEEEVVAVHFDPNGVVENVKVYGPDDTHKVKLVDRTTPTAGKEITFLQQLLGNVGRFNSAPGAGPAIPGGRVPGGRPGPY